MLQQAEERVVLVPRGSEVGRWGNPTELAPSGSLLRPRAPEGQGRVGHKRRRQSMAQSCGQLRSIDVYDPGESLPLPNGRTAPEQVFNVRIWAPTVRAAVSVETCIGQVAWRPGSSGCYMGIDALRRFRAMPFEGEDLGCIGPRTSKGNANRGGSSRRARG